MASHKSAGGPRREVVVVGAGIIGLAAALLLADNGHNVVIVARNLPGDMSKEWCSPWAGALLAPHPDSEFPGLQRSSLEVYESLRGDESTGIKKVQITEYYDDRPSSAPIWYESVVDGFRRMSLDELPEGVTLGLDYTGMIVNPNQLLPWMVSKLRAKGVTFIQKTLASFDELDNIAPGAVVVNASGLGAEKLAKDPAVLSARGQTMLVKCTDFNRVIIRQGSEYTYAIPRPANGVVVLGGVSQYNSTEEAIDPSIRPDILRRVNKMTGGTFDWVNLEADVERDIVGFRPAREGGMRLEREGRIVHAYGAKSLGYVYAFGVARRIRDLIQGENSPASKL